LVCDALVALWRLVTAPVRELIDEAIAEARESEARRALYKSLNWTTKDDRELERYARHCQ
jgi:hypothetical protein